MNTTNYEKHAKTWNPVSRFFLNNFSHVLLSELKKVHPASILDVGCGEGFTLNKLQKAKIGKHLEGIEYEDDAIALGRQVHPSLTIKKGDIYKLPYRDNSFDVVICSEVLEHLENPEAALQELKRVSKKYVALSVPNEPLFTIQRIFRGKNVLKLGAHPEHIQHWTSSQFKNFVGKHFTVVSDQTPLPWTLVIGKK